MVSSPAEELDLCWGEMARFNALGGLMKVLSFVAEINVYISRKAMGNH